MEYEYLPSNPIKMGLKGLCCAGIIDCLKSCGFGIALILKSCALEFVDFLKSFVIPIVKGFLKLLDVGLYSADIYSDIGLAVLLWDNCHYNYFGFSIAIIFVSYLSTILYLKKAVHKMAPIS